MRCCRATTIRPAMKATMRRRKPPHHIVHVVAYRRQRHTQSIAARCALPDGEMESRWFLAVVLVSALLESTERLLWAHGCPICRALNWRSVFITDNNRHCDVCILPYCLSKICLLLGVFCWSVFIKTSIYFDLMRVLTESYDDNFVHHLK